MTAILAIADRAVEAARRRSSHPADRLLKAEVMMDITATHANGCPLDLDKLLAAPDFDFAHDVFGIRRHLDRTTGELRDFFLPRCSVKQ